MTGATRQTPRRKQARHAEQQRRIAAALNFWEAALIQIEPRPDEATGAPPAEISEKILKSAEAPEERSAQGGEEARSERVFAPPKVTASEEGAQ